MITVKINAGMVLERLRRLPERASSALFQEITRIAISLQRDVIRNKLSGQVLKTRTGTLRRSINYNVTQTAKGITGTVGTNVVYAAAHEFGFHGRVTVPDHMRLIKMAWGRPITPVFAHVRGHSRNMNLPERSFLRSALNDKKAEIQKRIQDAMLKAAKSS